MELANIDYNNFQKMITNLYNNINFEFNNCLIDLDVKVDYQYKKVDNLFSFIKGKDTTQTLVIGAHYDHVPPKKYIDNPDSIRNGADDNASGVALLLELSKYYLLNQNTPVCNIAFIYFNAEESSMLGSKYFIKNKPSKFNNIKAMINLDMVGRMKNDFLYIGYTDSSDDWMKIINKIVTNRIHIQKLHSDNRCDNSSFCDAEIPNILFTTGIHEDLHKPTDECHKINFSSMNEIFEIIKHTIDETVKYDLLEYNKDF